MTSDRRGANRKSESAMIAELKSQVISLTDTLDSERKVWLSTNKSLDREVIELTYQLNRARDLIEHWTKFSKLAGQRATELIEGNPTTWRLKTFAIRDVYMVCAKQLAKILITKDV